MEQQGLKGISRDQQAHCHCFARRVLQEGTLLALDGFVNNQDYRVLSAIISYGFTEKFGKRKTKDVTSISVINTFSSSSKYKKGWSRKLIKCLSLILNLDCYFNVKTNCLVFVLELMSAYSVACIYLVWYNFSWEKQLKACFYNVKEKISNWFKIM